MPLYRQKRLSFFRCGRRSRQEFRQPCVVASFGRLTQVEGEHFQILRKPVQVRRDQRRIAGFRQVGIERIDRPVRRHPGMTTARATRNGSWSG